jgi:hypothetical protein
MSKLNSVHSTTSHPCNIHQPFCVNLKVSFPKVVHSAYYEKLKASISLYLKPSFSSSDFSRSLYELIFLLILIHGCLLDWDPLFVRKNSEWLMKIFIHKLAYDKINCIVTWRLSAGIVEQEVEAIARQRCDKHTSTATNKHATIEELLDAVFYSVWSAPRPYSKDQWK